MTSDVRFTRPSHSGGKADHRSHMFRLGGSCCLLLEWCRRCAASCAPLSVPCFRCGRARRDFCVSITTLLWTGLCPGFHEMREKGLILSLTVMRQKHIVQTVFRLGPSVCFDMYVKVCQTALHQTALSCLSVSTRVDENCCCFVEELQ